MGLCDGNWNGERGEPGGELAGIDADAELYAVGVAEQRDGGSRQDGDFDDHDYAIGRV